MAKRRQRQKKKTNKKKKTKTRQRGRKQPQRGGSMPWVVDIKKGYNVTRDMIKAVQKPIDWQKAKRDVAGYKREYQDYKRRGGSKGYSSWAVDKGYAKRSSACCIQ